MTLVYKILTEAEHDAFLASGRFDGSDADLADGFVHLSTAEQLHGTLQRHFAGRDDLVALALDAEGPATRLRWEPSRGGALFPHLYGPIGRDAVLARLRVGPFPRATTDVEDLLTRLAARIRATEIEPDPLSHP